MPHPDHKRLFIIRSDHNREDYWSNALGWTDLDLATRFTHEEHRTLNLPIGGRWLYEPARCRYCGRVATSTTLSECVNCFHVIAVHLDPGTVPTREAIAAAVCSCNTNGSA